VEDERKNAEIQFYTDRTIDSLIKIVRSIVDNPMLSADDRIEALLRIANLHGSISLDLQEKIHGKGVSLSLKSEP